MNANQQECLQQLVSVANEYCLLIETLKNVDGRLLDRFARLLPRLHAAVVELDGEFGKEFCGSASEFDQRFELFTRLRRLLGDHDGYRMDDDSMRGEEVMSGSLADDLTDIYFELKRGLKVLSEDPKSLSRAADLWCGSYLWHWGQHLVDAERHLYDLQVHRRLHTRPHHFA